MDFSLKNIFKTKDSSFPQKRTGKEYWTLLLVGSFVLFLIVLIGSIILFVRINRGVFSSSVDPTSSAGVEVDWQKLENIITSFGEKEKRFEEILNEPLNIQDPSL